MDRKILIIDDDAKLQDLLRAYLSDNGFAVASLFDGNEASSAIEKEGPDVVLLDIMLPGTNGLDVLRAVRASSSVPVMRERR
ncbi:MAG TPA: response regulator, partial [Spirochaetota bacterium]|nr:response regulator [Spirochaetota bacterium]